MKIPKSISCQVIVSIPRAGEFIATVRLDPEAEPLRREPVLDYTVENYVIEEATSRIVVKLAKGERARLKRLLTKINASRE